MSCLICAEDYTAGVKSIHQAICCPYCSFEACSTCCKRYILDQEANLCMNISKNSENQHVCRKEWSRKFMIESFHDSWIKGPWRKMTEKVGFDREKSLLPAAMPELERRRGEEQVRNELNILDRKIRKLVSEKQALQRRLIPVNNSSVNIDPERISRGRPCPAESCRGYLSSQWKCGACDLWTCPECHQLKGATRDIAHECNPDDVATAQLLNRDTKGCPSCSTPIHKIHGCDQMWCTQCHTGFSWRTGALSTRNIHNPHYFEFMRNQNNGHVPRRHGDVECGRDLGDMQAMQSINRALATYQVIEANSENKTKIQQYRMSIENIVRSVIHLNLVQLPKFRTDNVVNNLDLRLKYLEKNMSEAKFKEMIIRRDKAYIKKQDLYNLINLHILAVTDIIYRLENELKEVDSSSSIGKLQLFNNINTICQRHLLEVDEIVIYCNNLFREHASTYGCKTYSIRYNLTRTPTRYGNRSRVNDILI